MATTYNHRIQSCYLQTTGAFETLEYLRESRPMRETRIGRKPCH